MNRKGFTLVELLVSISILAILTILAIPTLRSFQSNNSNSKYINYRKAIETSAKLYNDSYSEDLFGNANYGCEKVYLNELLNKKVAKDISLKDTTCNVLANNSFVVIRKFKNEYKYEGYLYCENSNNNKQYSNMGDNQNKCVSNNGIPNIVLENDKKEDVDKKSKAKTVKIKLVDDYGFTAKQEIKYSWTKTETPPGNDSKYTLYKFENSYVESNGKPVELTSKSITNKEQNPNDLYWLHVKPVRVQNIINNSLNEIKTFGPFRFDNTPPSCDDITVTPNISSGKASKEVYFTFDYVKDSDIKSFTFNVSYDDGKNYKSYTLSKEDNKFVADDLDGKIKFQITNIVDLAGNKTSKCNEKGSFIRDTKKPSCTIAFSGTKGDNGWYKEKEVTVNLNSKDDGSYASGVATEDLTKSDKASYNGVKKLTQGNTRGQKFYGYVKDSAGNIGDCKSDSIKVDITAPTCTITPSGTQGNNSWFLSNVKLDLTTADGGNSGVSTYGLTSKKEEKYNKTNSLTHKKDTTKSTYYGYVKDSAGNKNDCSKTIKVEKTAPTLTIKEDGIIGTGQIKNASGTGETYTIYVGKYKQIPKVESISGIDHIDYNCKATKNKGTGTTTSNFIKTKYNEDHSILINPNLKTKDLFNIKVKCSPVLIDNAGRSASSNTVENILGNGWQIITTTDHYGEPYDYNWDYTYWQNGEMITGFHDLWWYNAAWDFDAAHEGVYDRYYFYTGNETNTKNMCHGKKNYAAYGWCKNLDNDHKGVYLFTHYNGLQTITPRWQPLNSMIMNMTIPVYIGWYDDGPVNVTFDKNGKCTNNCPSKCDSTGLKCS